MKFNKIFTYIVVVCMTLTLVGGVEYSVVRAVDKNDPGDIVENPWSGNHGGNITVPDLPLEYETTTTTTSENPTEKIQSKLEIFQKAGKVKVKAAKKKKSAKKVKITLKKTLKTADGYEIRFYKTKKNAKKNKKVLAKITCKKNKKVLTLKHKKLKNRKTLFICVRAYIKFGGKTYYSKKWSKLKKVKIRK